jgi:hypothetical protein
LLRVILEACNMNTPGLYYYNARYYDPQIGRFISADTFVQWSSGFNVVSSPLTVNIIPQGLGTVNAPQGNYPEFTMQSPVNPQNLNRYSYVVNNPINYTDPYGYWTKMIPFSIDLGIFNIYASGSLSLIWDDNGNWAIVESASVSVTSVSAVVNITGGYQYTDADTIWDILYGPSQISLSVEVGAGPSGAIEVITDINGEYSGIGVDVGLGGGFSISGKVDVYTNVLISNRSLERLTNIDVTLFGLFLNGEINQQTYVNFYLYSYWYDIDPSELFLWILMEMSQDE